MIPAQLEADRFDRLRRQHCFKIFFVQVQQHRIARRQAWRVIHCDAVDVKRIEVQRSAGIARAGQLRFVHQGVEQRTLAGIGHAHHDNVLAFGPFDRPQHFLRSAGNIFTGHDQSLNMDAQLLQPAVHKLRQLLAAHRFRQQVALGADDNDVLAEQMPVHAFQQTCFKIEQINHPQNQCVHRVDLRQNPVGINPFPHRKLQVVVMGQPETALAQHTARLGRIPGLLGTVVLQQRAAALASFTHHSLPFSRFLHAPTDGTPDFQPPGSAWSREYPG